MSLRDRLENIQGRSDNIQVLPQKALATDSHSYQSLKAGIHRALLDRVDLAVMESLPPERLREELKTLVERLLMEESVVINEIERKNIVRDIQHEMLGLGPLEILLADPTISDILVNTYRQVYVERAGKLELTDVSFNDELTCSRSSTRSYRGSAAISTNPARWWTHACRMARGSMRLSRPWRSMGRFCRSGVSP